MTWNALDTYVFSGVANGAVPAPTSYASPSTGQAWTDVQGGVWSVASGLLVGLTDAVDNNEQHRDLLLSGSSTDALNQRVVSYFTAGQVLAYGNYHRYNRSAPGAGYFVVYTSQGAEVVLQTVSSSGTPANVGSMLPVSLTSGHSYSMDSSVVGSSPTTISVTVTDLTTSTVVATTSWTDSTSGLQVSGAMGVTVTDTGANGQQTNKLSQINTYSYSSGPATAIAVTSPTTGTVSTASSAFTASVNGTLASNVTLTPASSVSGDTFTPATITFAAGSAPANQTFTLTPSATSGARTISYTNNGSLTNPTSTTYTASSASNTGSLPQPNIYFSPQGWDLSTSGHAIANASGNYLKAAFTTSATGAFSLNLNLANLISTDVQKPYLSWSIDGGAPATLQLTTANTTGSLVQLASSLAAGLHTLQMWVRGASPFANHWTTTATNAFIDITGFTAGGGGTIVFSPLTTLPNLMLCYGDSMTEGEGTDGFVTSGTASSYAQYDDATHSYVPHLANAFNCEYSVAAFGGQGWTGGAADGTTPGLNTTWNLLYSGKSRTFSAAITHVTVNMGTNGNTIGSTGTVSTFLTNLRAALNAAGSVAKIVVFVPWSGAARSGLIGDFTTYQGSVTTHTLDQITYYTGANDANAVLIDLGSPAGLPIPATTNSAGSLYSYDTTHLSTYGNLRIVPMAARAIQAAFTVGSGSTSSRSFSFS